MTHLNSATLGEIAAACPIGPAATVEELNTIHRSSVIRHAKIIASDINAATKIRNYFDDLKHFLEDYHFNGCPYTNALITTRGADPKIVAEVRDHKEFIREFFISLAKEITIDHKRAVHIGEQFFLLYAGATTESQNLGELWPIDRAIETVNSTVEQEISAAEWRSHNI